MTTRTPVRVFRMDREQYLAFAAMCGVPVEQAEAEYECLKRDAKVRALFANEKEQA
jgi:argininosuccinate synthase